MNVFEFENDCVVNMHTLSVATIVMSVPKIFWFVSCGRYQSVDSAGMSLM